MNWNFEEEILKNLIGKKIERLFGTYLQVFRDKDKKCFNELNKITLKIEGLFYSIQTDFQNSNIIDEGTSDTNFTCDFGGYSKWNEKIVELNYLDGWENIFSEFGFVIDKKNNEKEGFYIEINGYKKIFFIKKREVKVQLTSVLEGWEFIIETSIPNEYYNEQIKLSR